MSKTRKKVPRILYLGFNRSIGDVKRDELKQFAEGLLEIGVVRVDFPPGFRLKSGGDSPVDDRPLFQRIKTAAVCVFFFDCRENEDVFLQLGVAYGQGKKILAFLEEDPWNTRFYSGRFGPREGAKLARELQIPVVSLGTEPFCGRAMLDHFSRLTSPKALVSA